MKICYLLGGVNSGGLEHLVLDIFSNSKSSNFQFSCVYRNDGNLLEKFKQTGISLTKIKPNKRNYIKYFRELRNYILINKIDIVHAHVEIDAFYAWIALRNTGVKIILTSHGYNYDGNYIFKKISKFALKHVDYNLFVSDALKNYYNLHYDLDKSKSFTLYNGVSTSKLQSTNNLNLKKEFNLPDNSKIIGMVANFHGTGKDQITLCRAMNELVNKNQNLYLFFVGAFSDKTENSYTECYQYCKENNLLSNILFLGPRSNVPEIISNFDCFTYSSNHDTFGLAIVEAMLLKVPTLINDLPPFLEISNNGEFTTIFKSKNISHFINKLNQILENDQKIAIEKSYSWACSSFSIEKHIENLYNIYLKLN